MGNIDTLKKDQQPSPSKKDVFSRSPKLATSREKAKTQLEDPRKIEIKKAFPKLSQAWINKIYESYKKYSLEQVKIFFTHAKKYNQEKVPQSLIAVSLIQYAKNTESSLITSGYDEYVAHMITEHQRAVRLCDAFAKNDNPAFEDFKKRKKAQQNIVTTVEDVIAGKGFTNDTYFLYEYIESDVFQNNKQDIVAGLDSDQKATFAEYLDADVRLSQIAKINTAQLISTPVVSSNEVQSPQSSSEKNTLQYATQIFAKDFGKEHGPQIVFDNLPQNVLGNERLTSQEKETLRQEWQQTLSSTQRTTLVEIHRDLFPKQYTTADIVLALSGKSEDNLVEVAAKKGVLQLWEGLQQETFRVTKEKVMNVYFEQVGTILQAGGHVVQLENNDITYETDGSIHMQFTTTSGIHGEITIDKDGGVYVADLFGYQSMIETQTDYDLLKKNLQQRLQGKLPTMKTMISRVSNQKYDLLKGWYDVALSESKSIASLDTYTKVMISPEEEQARTLLHMNMKKTLLMTQSADAISHTLQTIERIHTPIQSDPFLRYCNGPDMLLDAVSMDTYKPLAILRQTLARSKNTDIERWNSACNMIIDSYQKHALNTKESFPFGVSEGEGKETFWQFLSRFCTSDTEFDIRSFEQVAHLLQNQTTPYTSMIDCYLDNPRYFPLKSLYLEKYASENILVAEQQLHANNSTRSALDDLQLDISLSNK